MATTPLREHAEAQKASATYRSGLIQRGVSEMGEGVYHYSDQAARIWLFSSIFWLTFVDLVGLIMATELVTPNLFGGVPWLLFSRIRPIHVNGVIFAWLSMMYFGGMFYILPRLLGLPKIWSERLGVWCAWAFNIMFAAAVITLASGMSTGREYFEFVWPVAALLLIIWTLNIFNILMTVLTRRIKPLYVAVWWAIASPMWLAADYFIAHVMWIPGSSLGIFGNAPGQTLSSALPDPMADGMINWWGSHNLFGLWLTPMLIMLVYYMIPRITNTPLYSHTLSLISFWGIIFFYAGVGHHHLLQAPIPGWLKTMATFNSIMLLVPVLAFIINIWLTMRGHWGLFTTNLPLRFALTGFIFYFLVNIQGSFMAVPVFNRVIHFTNFIVAHSHLALLGGFTILGMGVVDYIIPQVYHKPIFSRRLSVWQYWLIFIGFTGFFFVLTFASFLQGQNWAIGIPEVNVLPEIRPHYIARGVFGGMIVVSGIIQLVNIWLTVTRDTSRGKRDEMQPFITAGERLPSSAPAAPATR